MALPARANGHGWYRRRAIRANVGPVRLRLDHVIPWQPERLAIDPWTVLRLARYRRRDEAPAAVWDATRAMAVRAGELVEPAARLRLLRVAAHSRPGRPRTGPVLLRPLGRAPSRRRPARDRVRPDARPGARGRGHRPRRAPGAPRGLPPRPRGLGGDRGGGAGAPAGPDRGAPAGARLPPAGPRPPRLAAHRAERPRGPPRGRRRTRAALRARRPHPLQVDQRPLRAPRRGQTLTSEQFAEHWGRLNTSALGREPAGIRVAGATRRIVWKSKSDPKGPTGGL